jgi:thiol-disulfide isomerase/thioredoxin
MGRLPAVGLASVLALSSAAFGCNDKPSSAKPPVGRDNAVLATGSSSPAPAATSAAPKASAAAAPRKALCNAKPGSTLPKGKLQSFAAGGGASDLDPQLPVGVGKWVWVNLWASWCEPCKEEMPLIIGWQKKLAAAGAHVEVAFVSIDEDERQLQRFLDKQPGEGVRSSYWLPEGDLQTDLFAALGKDETPGLPLHALVAPSGTVDCLIDGEVKETDYPALAKLFGAKN